MTQGFGSCDRVAGSGVCLATRGIDALIEIEEVVDHEDDEGNGLVHLMIR